ncbi:sugar ABC transporter ATP-binding protein [Nocardioides sp. 1609]|uniref:sugar ABC transporter ATP-binding protein n=1 Tax=Nocardioides sp. 1609 TaxID=2508327 RepID=UPI00106FCC92|nr:sugar ABC transporter ATP-binding protein [Nocardioides sp. 1609]
MNSNQLLRTRGLGKSFPGQRALIDVDLDLHSGEIVAVVGQNGSGKSTLVKALTGIHDPDPGSRIEVRSASGDWLHGAATRAEIHVIHQDLGLIPMLNTVENLNLARAVGSRGWLPTSPRRERQAAKSLIRRFSGDFDVNAPIEKLTPGERSIVAIARALSNWPRPDQVLLLDEPTAALHGDEAARLFEAITRVAEQGAGVIFISHRLDEVLDLAHRVVALRGGRVVADVPTSELNRGKLIELIAGKSLASLDTGNRNLGAPTLEARAIRGGEVDGVSLTVHAGEIVGVAGILGSGREHLCGLLFGSTPRSAGSVLVQGKNLPASPRRAVSRGVGFVPSDRHADGAIMTMPARENLTLPSLRQLRGRLGNLRANAERREATLWANRVELDPPDPERTLELFSGGNQQKVVLAKWLRNQPVVLLLDEPTQGVDVGAKAAIYQLVIDAAAAGSAVVVSSSDSAELAELCDRVVVLRGGRIAAEVQRNELSEARLVTESLEAEISHPTTQPAEDAEEAPYVH